MPKKMTSISQQTRKQRGIGVIIWRLWSRRLLADTGCIVTWELEIIIRFVKWVHKGQFCYQKQLNLEAAGAWSEEQMSAEGASSIQDGITLRTVAGPVEEDSFSRGDESPDTGTDMNTVEVAPFLLVSKG
jgi:hypothetical protein